MINRNKRIPLRVNHLILFFVMVLSGEYPLRSFDANIVIIHQNVEYVKFFSANNGPRCLTDIFSEKEYKKSDFS